MKGVAPLKAFSIKRAIIILTLILIYSAAFCMVSIYAEKTILSEVKHTDSVPAVNLNANQATQSKPSEDYESAEEIASKQDMNGYDILSPQATKVSSVTTVTSETEESAASTKAPEAEENTTVTTTEATTAEATTTTPPETSEEVTTPVKITTEATTEEEIVEEDEEEEIDEDEKVEEDEDEIIEDHEELVTTISPEDEYNNWLMSSILKDIEDGKIVIPDLTPEQNPSNPDDNLNNSKSWKNETLTIYEKKSGRYLTGNAFDIICGVTFNEVGTSMHIEAIKAQAVAAYTYIKHYENKGEVAKISMKTDVPQEVIDAVEQVDGLCIYYDGEPIMAAFSASTGGYTSSSQNVWGGYRPYLQSVKNDYDYLDSKHYGRITTYTVDEVRKAIESKTDIKLSDNPENWIRIVDNVDTVYAGQMSIDGHLEAEVAGKDRKITGYIFRTHILGIRSTNFTVSYANGEFTFVTYGYGHGVGMSQIGANLYATYGGYSFDQILHHYYSGVVIK